MAGETAVQKGVNAGIVKEVAPIFGGGGGGRPNFAQGGGTKPDKLKDAVPAAEETIKKQLKPIELFEITLSLIYGVTNADLVEPVFMLIKRKPTTWRFVKICCLRNEYLITSS